MAGCGVVFGETTSADRTATTDNESILFIQPRNGS
jgi:hypothetical protein